MTAEAHPDLAPYISHEEFRDGLPKGRFRVVVDPGRARGYVRQRLWLTPLVMAFIGAGIVLALIGSVWPGALLVFTGIVLNRLVPRGAARILLYLAASDASVYDFATSNRILEVRRIETA